MTNVTYFYSAGGVSDPEWSDFYKTFITPFQECDADKDQKLIEAEF